MRWRPSIALIATIVLMVPAAGVRAQDRVWVASAGAKLKGEATASAPTVGDVAVGTELSVIESTGKWYHVKTGDGREGWIYSGKVSTTAPEQADSGLFGSLPGSSIEARTADTSRSVRGLSPETSEYAKNAGTPKAARDALDRVLALGLSDAEIDRFLEQGPIGEYAR